jgi:gliding motility-associated-like protein
VGITAQMSQGPYSFLLRFAVVAFFLLLVAGDGEAQGPVTITATPTNPTCLYNNGSFVVHVSGGTPPYSFLSYAAQQGNFSGIFANLVAGTYDINVFDATGTKYTSSVTLTGANLPLAFASTVSTNPTGCVTNDGTITVTPMGGGVAPYQYSIDNGASFQSSNVFSNLAAGTYGIWLKDGNGCITAPWSSTITSYVDFQYEGFAHLTNLGNPACPLQLNAYGMGPSCGSDNIITTYGATGGTPPYTYSLDGAPYAALTQDGYYFLSTGLHTIYVKDAAGLVNSYSYYFPSDCGLFANSTGASCGLKDGSITLSGGNGIPPFTYSIDGTNFQSSNVFSGLAAGSYDIIMKDADGATLAANSRVQSGCPSVTATASLAACGVANATILATATGGTAPYAFSRDGVNFQSSGVFLTVGAGTYTITVRDNAGYTGTTTVTVAEDCISLQISSVTATCGMANGSITATASNGTTPYQYSLDGVNFQGSGNFTAVAAGLYTVTVRDAAGATFSEAVVVGNVAGPVVSTSVSAASCLNNDGAVVVTAVGGTAPLVYSIGGGAFVGSGAFSGLASGGQTVAVRDANGCVTPATAVVPLNNDLTLVVGTGATICQGTGTGLTVNSNATAFSWTPADGLSNPGIAEPVATPSQTTTYYVTGALGACTLAGSVTITVLQAPVADAGAPVSICIGKSVQLQGSGGGQYQWSPATYLDDATIADPTVREPSHSLTYSLTVVDGAGCSSLQPATVLVTVTPPPKVFAGDDTAVLINQPLPLHALDVNNSGFTQYQWAPPQGLSDPSIADPVAQITGDIVYGVTATTADGCVGTDSITIQAYAYSDILVPGAFSPNNDGHNDVLRAIAMGIRDFRYFTVFDRWGQRVFYTTNASVGWDGAIGGKVQGPGVYVWLAMGVDFHGRVVERRGTVVLVR